MTSETQTKRIFILFILFYFII